MKRALLKLRMQIGFLRWTRKGGAAIKMYRGMRFRSGSPFIFFKNYGREREENKISFSCDLEMKVSPSCVKFLLRFPSVGQPW